MPIPSMTLMYVNMRCIVQHCTLPSVLYDRYGMCVTYEKGKEKRISLQGYILYQGDAVVGIFVRQTTKL